MRSIARIVMAVVVGAGLLAAASISVSAPPPPSLPQHLRQALRLLPPDIESLAGTLKPFVLDRSQKRGNWFTQSDAVLTFDAILELNLASVEWGESLRSALGSIRGREALWAVAAKRNQELQRERQTSIIVLGMHPYESITIIKFAATLPEEVRQALRRWSSPAAPPEGRAIFRRENVAAAVLIPEPDLLVLVTMIGSDDAMLKSVVTRIENPGSGGLAFDDAARAWSLIDLDASLWAIRRTRDGKPGQREDKVGRD
jgi:hypothetical protein